MIDDQTANIDTKFKYVSAHSTNVHNKTEEQLELTRPIAQSPSAVTLENFIENPVDKLLKDYNIR